MKSTIAHLVRPALALLLAAVVMVLSVTGGAWAMPTDAPRGPSTVPRPADLVLDKSGPKQAKPGETISYIIAVKNKGPGSASEVVVTDKLSPHVSFVRAESSPSCSERKEKNDRFVICTIGGLANGATATIKITVKIDPKTKANQIINWARVDANTPDKNHNNNKDEVKTSIKTK